MTMCENRLSVSETVNSQPSTINYVYDDIYQLTGETKTGAEPYSISYTYDDAGNRIQKTENRGQTTETTYTYNAGNQLVSLSSLPSPLYFSYDNNGNLISETDGTNTTNYTWDYENRLTQVTSNQFTVNNQYDGLGKRIAVTENGITTKYLYDGGLPIIEKDATDTTIATYTRGLSYGGGIGGIIRAKRGENNYYYHYNGIGGVTGLTDSSSAMVATYNYDSYGNTLSSTGSVPNPYGFSTKEFSSQSGLIYFGARYYNPEIGRWLSQDPLGMINGPNLYAYCKGNPINWVDPYGLFVFGKRSIPGWSKVPSWAKRNPIDNHFNTELSHEQGFYEDGSGEDVGFFNDDQVRPDDSTFDDYVYDTTHYDDDLMREAVENVRDAGEWDWDSNNCQDWADRLRDEYDRLREERENDKTDECDDGEPTNPDEP